MAQLLVRDVPDHIATALNKRAAENGRSAEAEHRAILETVLKPDLQEFLEAAAKLREETRGRILTPSEVLIRESRDER
jgi:plasmid stability protein